MSDLARPPRLSGLRWRAGIADFGLICLSPRNAQLATRNGDQKYKKITNIYRSSIAYQLWSNE